MFYIESMLIEGFRNYCQEKLQFHPRLNIIMGENAQGKTNLLESIFYLSVTRSFRTNRDRELVHWDGSFFFLKGTIVKDAFKYLIQLSYRHNDQLKALINDNPVNRYEHMQKFPVVVFSPDDLMLIREGPAVRRRFINLEISRLSYIYLKELKDYQRVLLHRNSILKDKDRRRRISDLLEPWDDSLIKLGVRIIKKRIEIIKALENEARVFFNQMTASQEMLALEYVGTVKQTEKIEEMEKLFARDLLAKRDQEIKRGSTLIGPHLDDIKISINGYDARYYSSQGQKRTAALALKMAEVNLFKRHNDACPVILLDDVFSEFDSNRKRHLLDFLNNNAGQYFLTTAVNLEDLVNSLNKEYKIITVSRGSVVNEATGPGS